MRDDIRKIKMGIDKLNCCDTETPLDITPIVDGLADNNAELVDINTELDNVVAAQGTTNSELGVVNDSLDTVNVRLGEIDVDVEAVGTAVGNLLADQQPIQKLNLRGFTVGSYNGKTMKQLMQTAYPGLDVTKVRSLRIFVPASTTTSMTVDGGVTNMKLAPAQIFVFEGTLRDTILTNLANIVMANSGAGTEEITIWFEIYS